MSLWFVVWFLVSVCLIGFLGWTLFTLYQQKQTWKQFAEKHGLRYKPKALMQVPEVEGELKGFKLSMFESEHFTEDARGSRKLTAIELNLNSIMPFEGAVANMGMMQIVKSLEFKAEFTPEHEQWNRSFVATGSSAHALKAYLTAERLGILLKILRLKAASSIFIFRNDAMLLRVDTPDPIQDFAYLEKLIGLLLKAGKILELHQGESAILKTEAAKADARDTRLDLDDEDTDNAGLSLELEEDGDIEAQSAAPVSKTPSNSEEDHKPGPQKVQGQIQKLSKPDTEKP